MTIAPARTPRESWIAAGMEALARGGPEAVRVEALARDLGTTKGSFYWHFADRRALLGAVLDEWERRLVDVVIEEVESGAGDERVKLRRLFGLASGAGELLEVDLAVRDWSRRERSVARRLRKVDNRRMDYMRSLFGARFAGADEVEARCMLAFSLWIGNHFIAADHRGRSRADVMRLASKTLGAT